MATAARWRKPQKLSQSSSAPAATADVVLDAVVNLGVTAALGAEADTGADAAGADTAGADARTEGGRLAAPCAAGVCGF